MLSELEVSRQGSLTLGVQSTALIPATMIESEVQNLLDIVQGLNRLQVATMTQSGIIDAEGDGGLETFGEDFDYDHNLVDD